MAVIGKALTAACAETREGAATDSIERLVPAFVAAPGSTDASNSSCYGRGTW